MPRNEVKMSFSKYMRFDDINLTRFNAVLLDLDDTLYQYKTCHEAAILACFEYHNFGLSLPEFRNLYRSSRTAVTKMLSPQASCRSRLFAFQKIVEEANYPTAYRLAYILDEIYWSRFIDSMVMDLNADAFVERCNINSLPICIVTDMTAHIQIRKIQRLGIADKIAYLVTSEEVGVEKPDRRMFDTALSKLGFDAKSCLMLGDNYTKDVQGALSVGMTAHLVNLYD